MRKIEKSLRLSKSYLGIILSLFTLDFGFRFILSNQINYNIGNFSAILFSLSFIFMISGLLSFIKSKYRKITYLIFNSSMIIITYLEYLNFQKTNTFLSVSAIFNQKILKLISYTDYKIVLVIMISLLISLITVYIMNKEDDKQRDNIDKMIMILIIIITVGGSYGIATMSLGKEVITNNKIIEEVPKNIYLHDIDDNKKMMISGLYEYLFSKLKEDLFNQFNYNKKRIEENYE